jgi:hypothetical protein
MKRNLIIAGIVVLGAALVGGLSYYFARSGGGPIDVNEKITTTDQQGFAQEVLPDTRAVVPNGGLRPQGSSPVVAPPEPAPAPAEEATTTEETASDEAGAEVEADADVSVQ